jgi:predicted Fe-S protein YdhL (DUF1289 family)
MPWKNLTSQMSYNSPEDIPISACTGRCGINEHKWCQGCGRTRSEIREWPEIDENSRREVYTRAIKRMDDLGRI